MFTPEYPQDFSTNEDVSVTDLEKFTLFESLCSEKEQSGLTDDMSRLAETCRLVPVTFEKRQLLLNSCFFLIKSGSFVIKYLTDSNVKIIDREIEAQGTVMFAFRSRKHEVLGDFVIVPSRYSDQLNNTVVILAISEGSIIKVPKDSFIKFTEKYPRIYRNLYFLTINKLNSSRNYIEAVQLNSNSPSSCLAKIILLIADELGIDESGKIIGFLTKQYLEALMSEKDPHTINGKLEELKAANLIDYNFRTRKKEDKFIQIIDKKGLEKIVTQKERLKNKIK
jgi:CRP-like cAMP-binding protein